MNTQLFHPNDKTVYWLFVILVGIGFADALYLSLTLVLDISPVCGPLHGCQTVASSEYSRLYGVPLAYLGTLYYALGALLSSIVIGLRKARQYVFAYASLGSLMSLWFIYIQALLIHAFCIYCLLSAVITFSLFFTTRIALKNSPVLVSSSISDEKSDIS